MADRQPIKFNVLIGLMAFLVGAFTLLAVSMMLSVSPGDVGDNVDSLRNALTAELKSIHDDVTFLKEVDAKSQAERVEIKQEVNELRDEVQK